MSQNATPVKKSKRKLLIIILVLITLAAGAGGGYYWWRMHQQTASGPAKPLPPPAPVFMALDTFTVNLQTPNNDPDRVLYIGLTLRLPDNAARDKLTEFQPEVRSRLLLLLSRQTPEVLATEDGKRQLVEQIKTVLSAPMGTGQPKVAVNDVLFTAFILR